MRSSRRLVAQILLVATGLFAAGCASSTTLENATSDQSDSASETPSIEVPADAAGADAVEPDSTESDQENGDESDPDENDSDLSDAGEAPERRPTPAPTSTALSEPRSGESDEGGSSVQDIGSMRDVDFLNGFAFADPTGFDLGELVVTDGVVTNGEFGDADYLFFSVTEVLIDDFNGDGVEDAIVGQAYNTGGSGVFEQVQAFQLVDGVVTDAGRVSFGDRAFGGIAQLRIKDGFASALTFTNGEGSCCPNEAADVRLTLGEHFLVTADTSQSLSWVGVGDTEELPELKFLEGTSTGYVNLWPVDAGGAFNLDAGAGQRLRVSVAAGPIPLSWTLTNIASGDSIATDGESVELPETGLYEIRVELDPNLTDPTTLLVGIDEELPAVTWTPATEQTVVSADPLIRTLLAWPVFQSETAAGLAEANRALAELVGGFDDFWIEEVTVLQIPEESSSYELDYRVTYAEDDLVSVRFSYLDYICCRPYPNYGPHATVVDLRAGRFVEPSEILDLSRLDEITALWLVALENQGLADAALIELQRVSPPEFDSIGLVDGGIEFGTGRGGLGGGSAGTDVTLTFAALGDLVRSDFLARLAR